MENPLNMLLGRQVRDTPSPGVSDVVGLRDAALYVAVCQLEAARWHLCNQPWFATTPSAVGLPLFVAVSFCDPFLPVFSIYSYYDVAVVWAKDARHRVSGLNGLLPRLSWSRRIRKSMHIDSTLQCT
ncbi:MAG: hypothetical protein R3C68_12635 [Myxococcota bacterium]